MLPQTRINGLIMRRNGNSPTKTSQCINYLFFIFKTGTALRYPTGKLFKAIECSYKISYWETIHCCRKWREDIILRNCNSVVCERYGTSQLFLEGSTDKYVQLISKLDRKHSKMLVELPTKHINLHYMLHKMRAKNPSCRRCGAEKKTYEHILCECLVLKKIRMQTFGFK